MKEFSSFDKYKLLVQSQHKITVDFKVEEVGIEVSHIENDMLDLEDEFPKIHHLKLPIGYILVKCRFKKTNNIKFFIVKVDK